MDKENTIKLVQAITWTDDETVENCAYDDQPNEAFDKGALWMKRKIIEELIKRG